MSSGVTPSQQGLAVEQVYEIQTMAEGGQFADALIRLRKVKAQYPQTTFFVALEKQLERLLVLPRDTDPTEAQKKELLDSLPGLIQGAVQAMRSGPPARPVPPPAPPRPAPDRVDREAARTQLKDQYFQHADEYLKKGAYGSALVEIRRVKIIAPDDKTALEYERTIRQLVELQQRAGIPTPAEESVHHAPPPPRSEERIAMIQDADTQWVPAPSIPAPPAHGHMDAPASHEPSGVLEPVGEAPTRRGGRKWWLFSVVLVALVGGTGLVTIISAADDSVAVARPEAQQSAPAPQETPATTQEQIVQPAGDVRTAPVPETTVVADGKPTDVPVTPAASPAAQPAKLGQEKPAAQIAPPPASATPDNAVVRPDVDPRIVELVHPVFTPEQKAMPGGEVIVMAQIDAEGKVIKTMVAKTTNAAFNQPIVTAVLRSTFAPGTTAAVPAVKWLTIPFRVN